MLACDLMLLLRMYEPYWQLDSRPFEHTLDTRFQFAAESQRGAMLKLRYVLENRRGAALLAGESGLGKTLVAQSLLSQLGDSHQPLVHLVYPQMPADQLLTYLADKLTGHNSPLTATIDQSVRRIEQALRQAANSGKHAAIVIDEAHLLRESHALEAIRLLMNFEQGGQPLATFLLVGQTGLAVAAERLPQLDERLAVKCILTRLSAEETRGYIQHRLSVAGAKRTIFEEGAFATIQELTHGIPRRINRLCDLALLVGYGEELKTLSAAHLESIHEELIGRAAAA
jgi:type II secretory pathway predicted ATPase ExeA